jgi:hypothetical protein
MDIMMFELGKLKMKERLSESSHKEAPSSSLASILMVVRNLPLR